MPVTVKGVTCNSLHVSCDSDEFESDERYAGWRKFVKYFRYPINTDPINSKKLVHCRALRVDL